MQGYPCPSLNIKYDLPGVIKGNNRGVIALTKNTKDHSKVIYNTIIFENYYDLVLSLWNKSPPLITLQTSSLNPFLAIITTVSSPPLTSSKPCSVHGGVLKYDQSKSLVTDFILYVLFIAIFLSFCFTVPPFYHPFIFHLYSSFE